MSVVRVGSKYRKPQGKIVCIVSVLERQEDGKFLCSYASGKTFIAEKAKIAAWELVHAVKVLEKKRIQQPTLIQACVAALSTEKRWMTPTELAKRLVEGGFYRFTPKAKTPWCTVSSRLNTHLSAGGKGIQKSKRGQFAAEGVEAPTVEAPATAPA